MKKLILVFAACLVLLSQTPLPSPTNGGGGGGAGLSSLTTTAPLTGCSSPCTSTATIGYTAPFSDFQLAVGPFTQTNSPVAIYTLPAFSLPAGKCLHIEFGIGPVTVSATIEAYVDGSTNRIAQWATGYTANVGEFTVNYCNNPAVQNAQTTYYPILPWSFGSIGTVPTPTAFAPASDAMVITPTAVDFSTTHVITMRTTAASGTITGAFEHSWIQ